MLITDDVAAYRRLRVIISQILKLEYHDLRCFFSLFLRVITSLIL